MGYQNYYDRDGRYAGYSSDGDGLDSFLNAPWWLLPVVLGLGFIIVFVLPVVALILIGILL